MHQILCMVTLDYSNSIVVVHDTIPVTARASSRNPVVAVRASQDPVNNLDHKVRHLRLVK